MTALTASALRSALGKKPVDRITPYDPPPDCEWRIISDIPSYEAGEYGHVRMAVPLGNYAAGTIKKPLATTCGYPQYVFKGGLARQVSRRAHRLVAHAFLADSYFEGAQIAHWDGTRDFCHHSNLRWATAKENGEDRVRHHTSLSGERHNLAKLTEQQVQEILACGWTVTGVELSRRYHVSQAMISLIRHGHNWRNIARSGE